MPYADERAISISLCGSQGLLGRHASSYVWLRRDAQEDFFDPHYLTRNLASLFGIPADRMRVPKIVAGTARRRRRLEEGLTAVDVEVMAEDLCANAAPYVRNEARPSGRRCRIRLAVPWGSPY